MKFGDTLYRRSVPKWAAYNLNYNELKRLIKHRTSEGAGNASPMPIPGQSHHRWSLLEDELCSILKEQYDHITLFLRSKHGEIERRLTYLDKSVRSAKRSAKLNTGRPTLQARKYQKLIQEAEGIGEDIQALSRFAAVQKTAFRKILKKYRKWTGSEALQRRLQVEVFSDGQLDINISEQMQHLAAQTATISDLQSALLQSDMSDHARKASEQQLESPCGQISRAAQSGPLQYDAAFASTPFGEAAGTATYWIHPDNLEEAKVLLLRYMRDVEFKGLDSARSSSDTLTQATSPAPTTVDAYTCYFDNVQRFAQDTSSSAPSRIAMCARWSKSKAALVTMSDMSPRSDACITLPVKRKDLPTVLDRCKNITKDKSASAANAKIVKDFLAQHRDLIALATQQSNRTRYVGLNNSTEVGTFAILDSNIAFTPFDNDNVASLAEPTTKSDFPHTVLQIRWEFGRKPEVVRSFDTTHLAENVPDFTLEAAAIHSQQPNVLKPLWTETLERDIRKVPLHVRPPKRENSLTGTTSAPSSTGESVFSAPIDQSAGSETSPVASISHPVKKDPRKKKKARILAESPSRQRSSARYYSEYDDPDSELYQQEVYTIYVDPDAEAPGMETLRKIGASISSIFTSKPPSKSLFDSNPTERTPLIDNRSSQDEADDNASSGSDSELSPNSRPKYLGLQGHVRPAERYRLRLSRRQRAFERTLIRMYSGLTILCYIFLLMSATMLATGRRKEVIEVDVGATIGVVVAFVCLTASIIMVYMRRQPLTKVEKVILTLADGLVVVAGAAVVVGIVQRARYHK